MSVAPDAPHDPLLAADLITDWPLFGLEDDVRPALAAAIAANAPLVLATLYAVVGGSPRAPGSQMTIASAQLSGFLSGGCIEADLVVHAAGVLRTGQPRRIVYGDGGDYPDIRLVCGGRVEILLEAIAPDDAAVGRLLALTASRRPALWVTDGTRRACWDADEATPAGLDLVLCEAACLLRADPDSICIAVDAGRELGLRRSPVRRMVVVGGDPTAMAIASLAAQTGFETWLVRPKGPERPPPFSDVRYDRRPPVQALPAIGLDPWTYVAIATHDLDADEAALATALRSPAAYVGVLGARRRLPERLERLRRLGVDEQALKRLNAPIGLDLGGKAPFEIAVAVVAQAIAQATTRSR